MRFADIVKYVQETASLSAASLPETERVQGFVNEACADFRADAQTVVAPFDVALTAGTAVYPVTALNAGGVVRLLTVASSGSGSVRVAPLEVVDPERMMELKLTGGLVAASTPAVVTMLGLTQLEVFPKPAAGARLTGYLVPYPAPLVNDNDVPGEQERWHRVIRHRAVQKALEWDRQPIADVQQYEAEYLKGVGQALALRRRAGGARPKRLRPGDAVGGDGGWTLRGAVGLD